MNGRAARLLVWVFAIQVMVSNCTVPLVVTGQTTSYHAADDGDLKLGAPFRYQDNGDGTITDLNTGLMWDKKCLDSDSCPAGTNLHNVNNRYDWNEGIWQWIAAVNAENDGRGYAGHNDWRIPNLRELLSIVDYGVFHPSIDSTFGPAFWFDCWSSTAHNAADAWAVDFDAGTVHTTTGGRADESCVRAVRGAPSLLATGQRTSYQVGDDGDLKLGVPIAYYDNGDGTITDLNTKLMWEKKCKDSDSCPAGTNLHNVSNRYDWNEGIWQWIAAVNAENDGRGYAGHNDWRIPNLRELQSIINYGLPPPSVNSIFGPTGVDNYWSSTTRSDPGFESPYAWFGGTYGGVGFTNKHDFEPVRAVRGGP